MSLVVPLQAPPLLGGRELDLGLDRELVPGPELEGPCPLGGSGRAGTSDLERSLASRVTSGSVDARCVSSEFQGSGVLHAGQASRTSSTGAPHDGQRRAGVTGRF